MNLQRLGLGILMSWLFPACTAEVSDPEAPDDLGTVEQAWKSASVSFRVRIENRSGNSGTPTAITPGVWSTHDGSRHLFNEGEVATKGIESLSEDGDPSALDASLAAEKGSHGVFSTPVGQNAAGPALPGQAYEFVVTTTAKAPYLSLATMFGESNDVFFAPDEEGIRLFHDNGTPIWKRTQAAGELALWDAGTEVNEAPRMGPVQAPRQGSANRGPQEGVLSLAVDSTRALPPATQIAQFLVTRTGKTFHITLKNVSAEERAAVTPIAPLFYASHGADWSLFKEGAPAGAALEGLAEDGSPAALVSSSLPTQELSAGAAMTPIGSEMAGPALPGQAYSFDVTPTKKRRYLSVATMVGQSNDAFLAFDQGVALASSKGELKAASEVERELNERLAVWDAGTEANEVPGAGLNQAPRQTAPNTGAADPDNRVRRYQDATNDLLGPSLGGLLRVTVSNGEGSSLRLRIENTSQNTAFPTGFSPFVAVLTKVATPLVNVDEKAPSFVERIAENGDASLWSAALKPAYPFVATLDSPVGGSAKGPILPGQAYEIDLPPDSGKYLNLASMVGRSNDTFVTLGATGVKLPPMGCDAQSLSAFEAAIAQALVAWDAGTEANQSFALGADVGPNQSAPDQGANEGDGSVRRLDQVWAFPSPSNLLRVSIERL